VAVDTAYSISKQKYDAVIFDMDGVVTDTAMSHAETWKRMFDEFVFRYSSGRGLPVRPFEIETDYRIFIDGKPRTDGVRSFLLSRGIDLPEGRPDDPAGTATVYGLGNLKNEYFTAMIRRQGVEVIGPTLEFIHRLKKLGFKTAIISSSRNSAMILESAELSELFDRKVDGIDSEMLGIEGKPAPDIFLEAARQLKVEPERAVIVEDAISGVQAGRAGGFGLVIGLARNGDRKALLDGGADLVVEELSRIHVKEDYPPGLFLPSALERFGEITRLARGKRIAIFLDYDGTLTPIVETPDKAVLPEDMRKTLLEISGKCTVGIISGRDLDNVRKLVNIGSVIYAGSHGFDIAGPEGLHLQNRIGTEFLPDLDAAEKELAEKLGPIQGTLVERKKFAIAVHFRLVAEEKIEAVEEIVDRIAARYPELRKTYGKKVFELQPDIDWHKGKALLSLLSALKLDGGDVMPVYIGDDVTDEDAFRALKKNGLGIVVRDEPYETAASYSLRNPAEVREFLLGLLRFCQVMPDE
jgi:trehalose 6-phosphate phosphatase